jgi:hypothetical protein
LQKRAEVAGVCYAGRRNIAPPFRDNRLQNGRRLWLSPDILAIYTGRGALQLFRIWENAIPETNIT